MPRPTTRTDSRQGGRLAFVDRTCAPARRLRPSSGARSVGDEPTLSTLAVHKRKVGDVRAWLTEALEGPPLLAKHRRILVLTGPAGAGKTATVRALSHRDALHFDVVEWLNQEAYSDRGVTRSVCEQFRSFLLSTARFRPLPLASRDCAARSQPRCVLLVEDWPNISHLETRHGVHAALEQFLEAVPHMPLILIVSDSIPRADTEAWDGSMDWRARLAGQMDIRTAVSERVRMHPACAEIRFNPLTPRMIQSALARQAPHIPTPVLADLSEASGGDIRRASTAAHAPMQLSQSDAALALFHAMGRLLYNKRLGDPDVMDHRLAEPLPLHRPRRSMVDVEALWKQLPVDASTFQVYVHHNLLQFADDVDDVVMALDAMSYADTIRLSSHGSYAEQYAFECMARGVLLSLPSPVQRRGQQLTKPALWEAMERRRACDEVFWRVVSDDVRCGRARCRIDELASYVLPLSARTSHTWSAITAPLTHFRETTSLGAVVQDALDAVDEAHASELVNDIPKFPSHVEEEVDATYADEASSASSLDDLDEDDLDTIAAEPST